ncbi:MAG: hypothetical protein IJT65_08350 [Eubacterium sp.]|nr:hypothetical protein [Eubacterium sp.]
MSDNKKIAIAIGSIMLIVVVIIISAVTKSIDNEKTTTTKYYTTTREYTTSGGYSSESSFSNKYGTRSTICAHPGCTNTIASSGDTNCCALHSKRCAQCGKYIDEDAIYCIDCLSDAASKYKSENSYTTTSSYYGNSYGSSYTKSYTTEKSYGYDKNDKYYAANDHNGDGKLSESEWQDAMGDAINDYYNGYY